MWKIREWEKYGMILKLVLKQLCGMFYLLAVMKTEEETGSCEETESCILDLSSCYPNRHPGRNIK